MKSVGRMDTRIALERNQPVAASGLGGAQDNWVALDTVWSCQEYLSGRELEDAQAVSSRAAVRFTVRYQDRISDLNTSDRVNCSGMVHKVEAVLPVPNRERARALLILASVRNDT